MYGSRGGPEPKLTRTVREQLVRSVRHGYPVTAAAADAGVSARSVQRWIAIGRREQGGPYAQLVRDLDRARADYHAKQSAPSGRRRRAEDVLDFALAAVNAAPPASADE